MMSQASRFSLLSTLEMPAKLQRWKVTGVSALLSRWLVRLSSVMSTSRAISFPVEPIRLINSDAWPP